MDITIIKSELTNQVTGIHLGNPQAKHQQIEFLNLACPYCKKWFEKAGPLLDQKTKEGDLFRVIKLLNKEKESLQKGNLLHTFIPADPTAALATIAKLFATQKTWQQLTEPEIVTYAREELGLTPKENPELSKIVTEAQQAQIQFVPTVLLDDQIFDETIDLATLAEYLA
ncbi:hypothetical protein UAS_00837 [Enterococcus asini ATCC 700915]|uniref:Thioredoxin-like fold domain-containing protein n=1 Tax=Enterococcus asini ATCC 700915 TaxID=1158606 RepID=R2S577_9ENTE|nr:thioredoxin domain-containing protein [Enterococcus asini]EOH88076.1 hypothetical protein UAS_00837 [Enterococcus asini ATCC 700915]EOT55873.1 hypothetical protein I579_02237 [Enterococcus asini ATCC 700915]OJG12852.1 hypothetical protein RU94_GL001858 [Enterococcus asini]